MSMNVFKYSVRSLIALTAYCLALVVGIGPGVASTVLAQGASPPLPPTGLTVTLKDYHSVRISWDDPQNSSITGYQVLRRSRDGDTYLDGLALGNSLPLRTTQALRIPCTRTPQYLPKLDTSTG